MTLVFDWLLQVKYGTLGLELILFTGGVAYDVVDDIAMQRFKYLKKKARKVKKQSISDDLEKIHNKN